MKIDAYTHVFPPKYLDKIQSLQPPGLLKRWRDITNIHDMESRMSMIDNFGDYKQIISISPPPFEVISPEASVELAQLANTELYNITQHPVYSERMPWFTASLPMNNMDASLAEIDRVIGMGAVGFQLYTNIEHIYPLDSLQFRPIFEKINSTNKPVWLHPHRHVTHEDYKSEDKSYFDIFWALGWPYESSACVARLIASGMIDELSNLKIIMHHWGGMFPYFEGRIKLWEQRGKVEYPLLETLKSRVYADTAVFGSPESEQACYSFWGASNSIFGTDTPFGLENGYHNIKETIAGIENLNCTDSDRQNIYYKNILRLIDR